MTKKRTPRRILTWSKRRIMDLWDPDSGRKKEIQWSQSGSDRRMGLCRIQSIHSRYEIE